MTNVAKRSFATGEAAPALCARSDIAAYQSALRTLLNGYVMRTGGIQSRPGTTYKGATKSNAAARLIRCVFNATTQNYVLEFGNLYVRFWLNGAQVTVSGVAAWADATVYAEGDIKSYSGTNYYCIAAHTSATADNRPSTGATWTTKWYALTGDILEVPTPYVTADLFELQTVETVTSGIGSLVIVHPSYAAAVLTRTSAQFWTLVDIADAAGGYVSSLAAPAGLASTGSSGTQTEYIVTAVDALNGLESDDSSTIGTAADLATLLATPETLSWSAVTGATGYNIYRKDENTAGAYGFLLLTTGLGYTDNAAFAADVNHAPPTPSDPFDVAGDYPGAVGFFQQRLLLAATDNDPYQVRASRTGDIFNYLVRSPLQPEDALSWKQVSRDLSAIRHFLDLNGLIVLTGEGEWVVEGNDSGILVGDSPPNLRQFAYNGASLTPPVYVNDTAVYVQARGGAVRDVRSTLQDGPQSAELSLTASHLVDANSIVQMAYQQVPHSIIWLVRDDGVLLSLTYQRETGVVGWARHVTDGTFESVVSVPESGEMAVYAVVNRTINAGTVRYIERLSDRSAALASLVCADAATVVDMAHPHSTLTVETSTATLSGNGYLYFDEECTGSGGTGSFVAGDVGRTFCIQAGSVRGYGLVTGYTSGTVITADIYWNSTASFGMTQPSQAFTTANWWWTSATGLTSLAGEAVSVTADGVVLASPNNPDAVTTVTVTSGGIANFGSVYLSGGDVAETETPVETDKYATAVVGLPFVTSLETLDIDRAGSSMKDAGVNVKKVGLWLEESMTPFVAQSLPVSDTSITGMQQMPMLDEDENVTTDPITGYRNVGIDGAWTNRGRIALRHVDPTPLSVLAIVASGDFGRG